MLAQTVKAMSDQELSELSRDVAREIARRGGRVSDGALSIAVAALQQIAQHGSQERDRVTAQAALDCIDALGSPATEEDAARLEAWRCPAAFHKTVCRECGRCQCWTHDHSYDAVRPSEWRPSLSAVREQEA